MKVPQSGSKFRLRVWRCAARRAMCFTASLCLVVSCQSWLRAQSTPVPPELVTERVVANEIRRLGSPDLVGFAERLEGLPESPLARGLARALLEITRGQADRARRTIERTLDARFEEDSSSSLAAALLRLWLEIGIDRDGRVFLVANGGNSAAVFPVARAVDLAHSSRCDEAIALLLEVEARLPTEPEALLLAAEAWDSCGDPGRALAVLTPASQGREPGEVDPRVAIRAGEILLEMGDVDSAALWCRIGLANAGEIPRQRHVAAACAAAADAMRGILPRARREYIAARRDALLDPALSADLRAEAGLAAAWVAIRSRDLQAASDALALLNELDAVSGSRRASQASAFLRAMALTTLERHAEARRVLDRAGAGEGDPELGILRGLAASSIQRGLGNPVSAATDLSGAATSARRAGLLGLLAEVEMDRAELARWEGRLQFAQHHALTAFETWLGASSQGRLGAFNDPVFERRAMQFIVRQGGVSRKAPEARVGRLLSLAEQLRGIKAGRNDSLESPPDAARVRRSLAARDSALLYYMVGETMSYAWLIEAAGMRVVELPPGEELYELVATDPLRLFGGLLDSLLPNSGLLIAPDAFLVGVPWHALEGPLNRPLGDSFTLSVVPSLDLIVSPAGVAQRDRGWREGLLAVVAPEAAGQVVSLRMEERFPVEPLTLLEAGDGDLPEISARYRQGTSILHLALPLECSGRTIDSLLLRLHAKSAGGYGSTFSLAEVLRRDLGCDLVALAPEGGWSLVPGSRVRAAFHAVRNGAGAAIVPMGPLSREAATAFWPRYYEALQRGENKALAVRSATASLPGVSLPDFQVVGHADTQIREREREEWPFWSALGGGLLIIVIVVLRAVWRRKDPFDVEPPEEEVV